MRMDDMGRQQERTERMEILWGLIERLSAPDLTLAEAKVLRGRISDLLEREDQPAGSGQRWMAQCFQFKGLQVRAKPSPALA